MSLFISKGLSIFLSCLIFLNAYCMSKFAKTWLFPACIFSLFWFVYTFFPLIILYNVPINPLAILYIFVCTFIFSLSSLLFNWEGAFKKNAEKIKEGGAQLFDSYFLKIFFFAGQLFVIVTILVNLSINGIEITDYIKNFWVTTNAFMVKRYTNTYVNNIFSHLGVVLNYADASIGGILLVANSKKSNLAFIFIFALLPSMLDMLLFADKGTLPLTFSLFYSGILIGRIFNNDFSLLTLRTIKVSLIGILITLPLLVSSLISRGLYEMHSNQLITNFALNVFSYAFGHLYAFSDWFSYYFLHNSKNFYSGYTNSYGIYTFTALFKALGSNLKIPPGTYGEYFTYKNILKTNIYTIFRGIILDYSFVGSLMFIFLSGTLFNFFYYRMLSIKKPVIAPAIFIIMFGAFYSSFMISLFIWNSVYIVFILLILIFFLNKFSYLTFYEYVMNFFSKNKIN